MLIKFTRTYTQMTIRNSKVFTARSLALQLYCNVTESCMQSSKEDSSSEQKEFASIEKVCLESLQACNFLGHLIRKVQLYIIFDSQKHLYFIPQYYASIIYQGLHSSIILKTAGEVALHASSCAAGQRKYLCQHNGQHNGQDCRVPIMLKIMLA